MDALLWQEKSLSLLDQEKYPEEVIWYDLKNYREGLPILASKAVVGEKIITVAGAYLYAMAAMEYENSMDFYKEMMTARKAILDCKPKAISLEDALNKIDKVMEDYRGNDQIVIAIIAAAVTIHRQDVVACRTMNRNGKDIISPMANVLLHAKNDIFHTGGFGGPIGMLRTAMGKDGLTQVYVCENRPQQEGLRLVAHELASLGIPSTVIPDQSAASLMAKGLCDMLLIEGLKVVANGDVLVNVGAYQLAIAAYFHSIPIYVSLYSSTVDMKTPTGASYKLGEGDSSPLKYLDGKDILPEKVSTFTADFDMLPHFMVTGLITDKGIMFQPLEETIPELMAKEKAQNIIYF